MSRTIGHYTLVRKLGEGAMGVVWSARDERLGRTVAIKLLQRESGDANARPRLMREARAAASVNHPNVCHVYDVGEDEGELFVAMELLEGEPLSARIARGPIAIDRAVEIAVSILSALDALHASGIVHRDLKPSNIFLTPHGVKLLDFGLARPLGPLAAGGTDLTTPGTLVGTPRYMAPEQWAGGPAGPAADVFASGAVLYEMLTGSPAFEGSTLPAVCHAIVHENPPALAGGPLVQAIDAILHRALAKKAAERFASAGDMERELRALSQRPESSATSATAVTRVRPVTRLIVLPLTLLRPDPEVDFLPVALSDAITASLCGLESLVVRSTRTAARYASADPDLRKLAAEAEVDAAVVGTLLRGGSRIRLNAQLVEVPAGTVLWSKTFDAPLSDIFEVQDELTGRVVEALAIPLSSREERQLHRDVPASARAYELYLRANHVGIAVTSSSQLSTARDLYRSCLQDDPRFAPAWARLGRVYRIMAKYGHGEWRENVRLAEEAFAKAFELNPDSPLAHSYYTYFELEERGDAPGAVVRLLGRVRARAADPEIFAGLVTAARFCGLYEASLAAHERARRLDPRIRTSVPFTHWMRGDLESAIASDHDHPPLIRIWSLALLDEPRARGELQALAASPVDGVEHHAIRYTLASFDGEAAAVEREVSALLSGGFHDPEGIYMATRALARLGPADRAIDALRLIVDKNFCVHESLPRDPWFASIRDLPETRQILAESRRRHLAAAERFREADGANLLGIAG